MQPDAGQSAAATDPLALNFLVLVPLIFIGSGVGGVFRYLLASWVQGHTIASQRLTGPVAFPVGTLAVNVTGCLAIGYLATALGGSWPVRPEYRLAVIVGLIGGYTTFSSFGLEVLQLVESGQHISAGLYVTASNILGLLATWTGWRLSQ